MNGTLECVTVALRDVLVGMMGTGRSSTLDILEIFFNSSDTMDIEGPVHH